MLSFFMALFGSPPPLSLSLCMYLYKFYTYFEIYEKRGYNGTHDSKIEQRRSLPFLFTLYIPYTVCLSLRESSSGVSRSSSVFTKLAHAFSSVYYVCAAKRRQMSSFRYILFRVFFILSSSRFFFFFIKTCTQTRSSYICDAFPSSCAQSEVYIPIIFGIVRVYISSAYNSIVAVRGGVLSRRWNPHYVCQRVQ